MTDQNEHEKSTDVSGSRQERVVMMAPYVAEEHRELLHTAYRVLEEYQQSLIARLRRELDYGNGATQPHTESLMKMERAFRDDPVRQELVKQLGNIKMLVERPRFMVKAT